MSPWLPDPQGEARRPHLNKKLQLTVYQSCYLERFHIAWFLIHQLKDDSHPSGNAVSTDSHDQPTNMSSVQKYHVWQTSKCVRWATITGTKAHRIKQKFKLNNKNASYIFLSHVLLSPLIFWAKWVLLRGDCEMFATQFIKLLEEGDHTRRRKINVST